MHRGEGKPMQTRSVETCATSRVKLVKDTTLDIHSSSDSLAQYE